MPPARKDAVRNYTELMIAAQAAVAEYGPAVPFKTIADAAGVGRATLYRNFPTREALLEALLNYTLESMEEFAERQRGPDAIEAVLNFYIDRARTNAALSNYWRAVDPMHPLMAAAKARFVAMIEPLLVRAKAASALRKEIVADDIRNVIAMLGALVPLNGDDDPAVVMRRMLHFLLHGMSVR